MKQNEQVLEELNQELKEYETKQNKLYRAFTRNHELTKSQLDGMQVQLAGLNTLIIGLRMRIDDLEIQVKDDESKN